jgi:16S rRNA (guanine527-N7)-methyltransferase
MGVFEFEFAGTPIAFKDDGMSLSDSSLSMEASSWVRLRAALPQLDSITWDRLEIWAEAVRRWNDQLNLISRKDIDNLEIRHLGHALAILKFVKFPTGGRILDVGTGGGIPGLPLAICCPDTQFVLVDSIQKKVKAVQAIADELELGNVQTRHIRAEEIKDSFDGVLGRAVTSLDKFIPWIHHRLKKNSAPGLIYWKGGNWMAELEGTPYPKPTVYDLKGYLADEFYDERSLLHFKALR